MHPVHLSTVGRGKPWGMTKTTHSSAPGSRALALGDRIFHVPLLPLRQNRFVYPIVRELSAAPNDPESFIGRLVAAEGSPEHVTTEELDQLAEAVFHAATAADPTLTRDEFEDLPITPAQLIDGFFVVRLQTGAWRTPEDDSSSTAAEGEGAPGEASGA